jgi:hypothetical protein
MPKKFGLFVGINQYEDSLHIPGFKNLKFAERDAAELCTLFKNQLSWTTYLLTTGQNSSEGKNRAEPANRANILRILDKVKSSNSNDVFLVFFSGHGIRENQDDYILLSDSLVNNPVDTALSQKKILDILKNKRFSKVLFLIDACRNYRSTGAKGYEDFGSYGTATFYSCSPGQRSYEVDELKHGIFTFSLIEILQKRQQSKSKLNLEELADELKCRVPKICEKYNKGEQIPLLSVEQYDFPENFFLLEDGDIYSCQTTKPDDVQETSLIREIFSDILETKETLDTAVMDESQAEDLLKSLARFNCLNIYVEEQKKVAEILINYYGYIRHRGDPRTSWMRKEKIASKKSVIKKLREIIVNLSDVDKKSILEILHDSFLRDCFY